jgi:hypothetical protein
MKNNNNITQPQRQQTSVIIEGLDTSTPDDLVKDGKCSKLHNLRIKDGAWRPVHQHPIKTKIRLDEIFYNEEDGGIFPDTAKVVYHHPAAGEDTYIVETVKNGKYSYYSIKDTFSSPDDTQGALIATFDEEMKISHFGNVVFFTNNKDIIHTYILQVSLSGGFRYKEFFRPTPPSVRQATQKWKERPALKSGDTEFPDGGYDANEEYENWVDIGNRTISMPPTHYSTEMYSLNPNANNFKKFSGDAKWSTTAWGAHWQLATNDGELLISPFSEDPTHDGYFWGEFAYFVCYRMADGTILSPSPVSIFCTEVAPPKHMYQTIRKYDNGYVYLTVHRGAGASVPIYELISPQMQCGVCDVHIEIPGDIDTSMVQEVAIYATRLNPIFDMGELGELSYSSNLMNVEKEEVTPSGANSDGSPHYVYNYTYKDIPLDKSTRFAENRLVEQPFYLIHSIPIASMKKNFPYRQADITIDYYMLRDAVSKPMYVPDNNIHDVFWRNSIEYNNRMHIFNFSTILAPTPDITSPLVAKDYEIFDNIVNWDFQTYIRINNISRVAPNSGKAFSGMNVSWTGWPYPSLYCASYHDYRAFNVRGFFYDTGTKQILQERLYPLVSSPGNNISYLTRSDDVLKYARLPYLASFTIDASNNYIYTPAKNNSFDTTDQIRLSSANNPFSWPFNNTYSVGSNNSKILALQSAAIEMADSKFGEMPLYAFTEEGIFALQAGESTLYSSVIPINYDKIINDEVLAINYNLAYITEKGLHLLNGNGSQLISSPLNGLDGSPMDMWGRVKLLNPQSFNEIICYDEQSGKAYIFNLDHQYWSSRDMQGLMINNNKSVLEDGTIIDVTQESDAPQTPYSFITRPIKLGDLEFKRLETIIPRMQVVATIDRNKMEAQFNIDAASNHAAKVVAGDGLMYPELSFDNMRNIDITSASMFGNLYIRRTPYSAKYFRFRFNTEKAETAEVAITNIDVEWYHKFLRKMR